MIGVNFTEPDLNWLGWAADYAADKEIEMSDNWIKSATDKMKAKGTLGSFGKATPKKIAAAKKEGGKEEKKAVFAQNMKRISARKKA